MEKFLLKTKIFIVLIVIPFLSGAQDLSNHYSYLNNFYNLNPAYAGSGDDIEFVASYRSPWSGVKGVNNNIMAGLHSPFYSHEGVGVKMISDSRGPFKTFIAEGQFAHEIKSRSGGGLRFGMSAGVIQKRFDITEDANNYVDFSDPTLKDSYYNQLNFRIGFGILFRMKGLGIGLSAPNLIETNNIVSDFLAGTITYKMEVSKNFTLTPIFVYKNLPVSRNQMDLMLRGDFSEKFWAQAGYRSNQSYMAALGFKLAQFGVGYGYELHKGYLEYLSRDMHEVVLTFNMENNFNYVKRKRRAF